MKYDIQTGKPLRVVNGLLLDIPDCFRNGAPFLDCTYSFEETFGLKVRDAERESIRRRAIDVDKAVRQLIADGKFSRQCTCDDLEVTQQKEFIRGRDERVSNIRIKGSGYRKQLPVEQFACASSSVLPPWSAIGSLRVPAEGGLSEADDGVHFKWTPLKGFTDYGPLKFRQNCPAATPTGSGHREGDDDSPVPRRNSWNEAKRRE